MSTRPTVSIVVPVLDEAEVLGELHRRVRAALADITHEIVYVDDGSTDASAAIVEEFAAVEDGVVLVQLSRNFGMEVAMSAGLDHAQGDYVVLMHADLQDPPELVPDMLRAALDGADVVYARRIGRDESWVKRTLATAFYQLMARLARTPFQGQAGDFRVMSRRVVDTLREMPERRRFLRGMVAWVGFEQVPIEYRRSGRANGRGASYRQLFRLAFEAVTSFSDVPLALATYFGIVVAMASSVAARGDPRRHARRLAGRRPRRLDPRGDPVPRRRAADQRGDPGALSGTGARADAPTTAVPGVARGDLPRYFRRITGRSTR